MASLPLVAVLHLAMAHAPTVAPETIATFAQVESGLNPYALYDNTERKGYRPTSAMEAAALAKSLLEKGHSIDTGLMQINSANFGWVGLNHITAFDPERSVKAGAMVLAEAYQRCTGQSLSADPLRCMASIYNTGNHRRGEANGYVAKIYEAADTLVPAIRQAINGKTVPPTAPAQSQAAPPHGCGPPPPRWDGWAVSDHQRCIRNSQVAQPKTENSSEIQ
jgi:type IV secretion system protein VirB1